MGNCDFRNNTGVVPYLYRKECFTTMDNQRDSINILGVNIDMVTMAEAQARMAEFLKDDKPHSVFTPNSEFIHRAYKERKFKDKTPFGDLINTGDLIIPDGIGVVYASRILKKPLSERVAGYDLVCGTLEYMATYGGSVFLFGSKPGVAEAATKKVAETYPGIVIAGTRDGYFEDADNAGIIAQINASGADMVLVCLGAYKQEQWINLHKDTLCAKVLVGAGGTLDGLAGYAERAPEAWRNKGLEWLYRLKKEPKRFWRMTALPRFALLVIFRGKRYRKQKHK